MPAGPFSGQTPMQEPLHRSIGSRTAVQHQPKQSEWSAVEAFSSGLLSNSLSSRACLAALRSGLPGSSFPRFINGYRACKQGVERTRCNQIDIALAGPRD